MTNPFGPSRLAAAGVLCLLVAALAAFVLAQEAGPSHGHQLLRKYAGSDDTDALLREPPVQESLRQLLGEEIQHLLENLDVRGSADLISGVLSLSGNAPHQGTVEEAVVCVSTYNPDVSAAIFSDGNVTVYSRTTQYENLPLCIKDWITLVNSEHRDRLMQPPNVRMAGGP
jgi:hypothetical protein